MDLVLAVGRLPREGETLSGGDLALFPGGKGANQACAAARLGGRVFMIGQVGADPFGPKLLASLREAGVDVSRVGTSERPTGCACIYVLPDGENSIVISPGANATVDPATALSRLEDLAEGDLLLAQLEIPIETVEAAFTHAGKRGAIAILDPAPARPLPAGLLATVGVLTPNQTEAACVLGDLSSEVRDFDEAAAAAGRLIQLGPRAVVMKLGSLGSLWSNGTAQERAEAFRVTAVDTTAAGDVFNGAFAVALAEGAAVATALRFANAAAAISVTRAGAQTSVPGRVEVDHLVMRGTFP
jgi:ribokinase